MSETKDKIGILDPKGVLHECEPYEHLDLAWEIVVDDMGNKARVLNRLQAEEHLQRQGWVVVRRNDVYGMIGYLIDPTDISKEEKIHLTKEQRSWLENNYEHMSAAKRKSVDDMFRWDN